MASAFSTAGTISNLTSTSTESLVVNGTAMEFKYVTGGGGAGKGLTSQQYLINGVATGTTTAAYGSANYILSFATTIPGGATVTAATLNLVTAVQQAMALNSATLETSKSFSTSCATIGPTQGGNCRTDPFTNTVSGQLAKLKAINIGATTYTYAGTGIDIATLGTVNLGTLNPNFLVELSNGGSINLTWNQAVSITGSLSGATIGTNMLCKNCTVYYATTSSASQNTRLTATFNANYYTAPVPELSSWAGIACGLLLIGVSRALKRQR